MVGCGWFAIYLSMERRDSVCKASAVRGTREGCERKSVLPGQQEQETWAFPSGGQFDT